MLSSSKHTSNDNSNSNSNMNDSHNRMRWRKWRQTRTRMACPPPVLTASAHTELGGPQGSFLCAVFWHQGIAAVVL